VFHGHSDSVKDEGTFSTPMQISSSGRTHVTHLFNIVCPGKTNPFEMTLLLASIGRPAVAEEVNTYLPQGTLPTPSIS
jgi:hypothetical protein